MEEELECMCCGELLYQPVVLLNCLHHACGHCILAYFKRSLAQNPSNDLLCPLCRDPVAATRDSFYMANIVAKFVAEKPQCESRTQQQKDDIRDNIYDSKSRLDVVQLAKDQAAKDREATKDPSIPSSPISGATNLFTKLFNPSAHHDIWSKCPTCRPQNHYGLICEEPVKSGTKRSGDLPTGHVECFQCSSLLPAVEGVMCTICNAGICSALMGPSSPCKQRKLFQLSDFSLHSAKSKQSPSAILPCLFRDHPSIGTVLEKHLQDSGLAFQEFAVHLIKTCSADDLKLARWQGPRKVGQAPHVGKENWLCDLCALGVLEAAIYELFTSPHKALPELPVPSLTPAEMPAPVPPRNILSASSNPPLPASAAPFRDIDASPIFAAFIHIPTSPGVLVGKYCPTMRNNRLRYGDLSKPNKESTADIFEIVNINEDVMEWIWCDESGLKSESLKGRRLVQGAWNEFGSLAVAATWVKGARVPGMASTNFGGIVVPYGNKTILKTRDYHVLVWK